MTLKELNVTIRKSFNEPEFSAYQNLWQTSNLLEGADPYTEHTSTFPKFLSGISLSTVVTFVGFHPIRLLNGGQIINERSLGTYLTSSISSIDLATKLIIEN